eukprot:1139526-Pelagomonas_calceolata.AAC.8
MHGKSPGQVNCRVIKRMLATHTTRSGVSQLSSTYLKLLGVESRCLSSAASSLSAQIVVISASLHTSRASASSSGSPPAAAAIVQKDVRVRECI